MIILSISHRSSGLASRINDSLLSMKRDRSMGNGARKNPLHFGADQDKELDPEILDLGHFGPQRRCTLY